MDIEQITGSKRSLWADKRVLLASRLFLLILLPFLFGAFLLPHTQPVYVQSIETPAQSAGAGSPSAGNASGGIGNAFAPSPSANNASSYDFTYSGGGLVSPDSLNAVFPLAHYINFPPFVMIDQLQVCFSQNGSQVIFKNGTRTAANLSWTVRLDDGTTLPIREGLAACTDARSGQMHADWSAAPVPPFPGNLSDVAAFENTPDTYVRVIMDYGILQGLAMIPAFFLIVYYPAAGIWKKLHEGMGAQ